MKFHCDKKILQQVIQYVSLAVSIKSPLPCLEGILLQCQNQTLTLTAYNLELGIIKSIPVEGTTDGAIVLNASLFTNIVTKMPDGRIELQVDERAQTVVSAGGATFTILGLSPDDYPELPNITQETHFTIAGDLLHNMINQTLFSVAQTDQNPIYTGSLFTLAGGVFTIVAVDGYRLALRKELLVLPEKTEDAQVATTTNSVPQSFSFIVPGKTLQELQKMLHKWTIMEKEEKTVTISLSHQHIIFSCFGYSIISRLIEGEFLNYAQTIPTAQTTTVLLKTKDFLDSLGRVSIVINDRAKSPVVCQFTKDAVAALSCETPMGKAEDSFALSIQGEELTISFNNKYMQDALKASACEEVRLNFNGPFSPIKIIPAQPEDDDFLFLVLPVRA